MIRSLLTSMLLVAAIGCSGRSTGPAPLPDRSNAVIQGVNYVGMTVSDLDQITTFYSEPAKMETVQDGVIEDNALFDTLADRKDVRVDTRLIKSVNAQLRLMKFANPSNQALATPPEDIHGPGYSHVCFQAAKKTNIYERFLQAGGMPLGVRNMVQLSSRNPVDYAYARDADGTIFEVEEVDIAALDLDTPPKNDYRLRHVAIATPDVDRAAAFYSILLQDPKPRRIGGSKGFGGDKVDQLSGLSDAKIRMAWFQIRNVEFEIGQYASHPTKTPASARPIDALGYNMVVFDVTDLDAAREKLLAAGGTVVTDVALLDGGEIFFGRDPDKNLLGFQTIDAGAAVSAKNFKNNGT